MIQTHTLPSLRAGWLLRGVALSMALAAVAVGALVLSMALRSGPPSAPRGVILYTTAQGDVTVRPDGQPVAVDGPPAVQFVASGGIEEFPAPGGAAVAYVERGEGGAWLAVRAGGTSRRLAQLADQSSPPLVDGVKGDARVVGGVPLTVAWSPDARYLAYGSLSGAPYTLHVVESGSWSQRTHQVEGGFIGELVWSPTGDRLAISTYSADRLDHSAYVLDPDGGAPVRLIDGCHIVWSPDGRYLALRRDPHRAPGAWIVAVDGSEAYALSHDRTAFPLFWQPE